MPPTVFGAPKSVTPGSFPDAEVGVTGMTAQSKDFTDKLTSVAPLVFGFVLLLAFGIMLAAFRSLVIAVKAILLNLLSIAAAYGVMVLVFQHGWGKGILGFESTAGIDSFLPIFMFVILFGLSMDYHVFIVSRMREAYDRGMSTEQAVTHGIKTTAGVVTSAAIVMVCVFAVFATLSMLIFKQFGVGLAAAILIDATIVRAVLLPATMKLWATGTGTCRRGSSGSRTSTTAARPRRSRRLRSRPPASSVTMTSVTEPIVDSRRAAVARAAAALRTETGLARLGLGIAALHVVDDNFVQPQPGTSAGDHLAGGLVQVAFFLLAAWAYPRLRPGARATLAIFVGIFVAVMGIGEAGYYTRENGPSGDDYTGLLAIPAGLLLVGIGAATLWRSRKGGGLARRYGRRALVALGLLLGAYFVVYPISEAYVLTHAARAYVPAPALGTAHEEVAFTTADGLRLEGWFVPSRNGATVVVFPGRKGPQAPARMLARHGYGVLLFDRRGEGASEGDPNALGWAGTRDLEAAVAYLRERDDVDDSRIGGLGLSVGGEMLLQFAAEADHLKAVVSEGAGIRSVREATELSGSERLVAAPVFALVTAATAVFASDLPPPSLKDLSAEISAPVFFIYATPGQGGESLSQTYYEAARRPKEIWAADGGHTGALEAQPEEYERRVVGFFDDNLLEGR